jgi:cytochrome c oxidase assembly protein subunit 15
MTQESRSTGKLHTFSWALIFYTIIIIAWGAWVRISGSGDGCGDDWPLCKGMAIPTGEASKTWIEVSHRYSTMLFGFLVLAQLWLIRGVFPKRHPTRYWVLATLLFTVTEALIGRLLVVYGLVHESTSHARLFIMPLHLINTSLLLFSEVMTAESVLFGEREVRPLSPVLKRAGFAVLITATLLLTTGAVAALGSHLFPSLSLMEGLTKDFAQGAHPALRLRILHPTLALILPLGLWYIFSNSTLEASNGALCAMYRSLAVAVLVMLMIGVATLVTLAPVWLKLSHLTMANVLVVLASRCVFHTLRPPQS